MRAAILGTTLAVALLGAAQAETPAPATPPAVSPAAPQAVAPAAAAAPAEAPKPSDRQIAAALDLLDATNSMSNMTQLVDAMMSFATVQMKREHSGLDDAQIESFKKILSDELIAREPDYKRAIAVVYAEHFSEADLHALADFYRSDLGKRYIATLPAMIKEMTPAGILWGEQVARDALDKFLKTLPKTKDHA